MKKRVLSILLALCLAVSLLPTLAFAQQTVRQVSTAEELTAAVSESGSGNVVRLTANITVGRLEIGRAVTLDLNNYTLEATGIVVNFEFAATGGTIAAPVYNSVGGTIKDGTFSGAVSNSYVISGGTFLGTVENHGALPAAGQVQWMKALITGGEFYGEVTNGSVNEGSQFPGTITGGSFYKKVTNTGYGMITGGSFYGAVESNAERLLRNNTSFGCIMGGTFYDGLTDNSTGDYSVPTCTVTYMSFGSEYTRQVAEKGSPVTAPKDPTKDYYQFVEWRTADGKAYDFNTAVTENITLTAQWSTGLTGEGTAEAPYQLSSKDDLKLFRDMVNSGEYGLCAVLTADIDLNNEEWTPIGNASDYDYDNTKAYSGIFDGGGHTISGLNVTNNSFHAGLFGLISGATVQDLSISGSMTGSYSHFGSIAGTAKENSTIKNCSSHCNVTNTRGTYAGGVVGMLFPNATIIDCYNTGTIHQDPSDRGNPETGGIVGRNSGTIRNCYNVGSVSCNDKTFLGSIAGLNMYSPNSKGTVENCYYLDGTGLNAVGRNDREGNITNTEAKTAANFADGTVLALLKAGERTGTDPWADTCQYVAAAGRTLPVFKGQGDTHEHSGAWKSNGDGTHSLTCACGVTETDSCSSGAATCTGRAVCEICGQEYGDYGSHDYSVNWTVDDSEHWHECIRCGNRIDVAAHTDENRDHKCDVCRLLISVHTGGTATCAEEAVCEICGQKYGGRVSHDYSAAWATDDGEHWHECVRCGSRTDAAAHTDENKDHKCDTCGLVISVHSGGAATCTGKAVCEICGKE